MMTAFVTLLLLISLVHHDVVRAASDVSARVDYAISVQVRREGTWEYIVDMDGNLIDSNLPIYVNELIRFYVEWAVDDMAGVGEGDYFDIPLPVLYINIANRAAMPFYDGNDPSKKLGEWSIVNGVIHVVLMDFAIGRLYLENGYFMADGIASLSGSGQSFEVGGHEIEIEEDPNILNRENPHDTRLVKQGQHLPDMDIIEWDVYVNYDNYKKVYEGETPEQLINAVLVDEIPDDQIFTPDSNNLLIRTIVYMPTSSGAMSGSRVFEIPLNHVFTELVPISGETYTEFFARVNALPVSYGIFNQTVMINFGNLPNGGSGIRGPWTSDTDLILNYIYTAQVPVGPAANTLQSAFSSSNTAQGDLIGFNVRIRTTPVDPDTNQMLGNRAVLYYNLVSEDVQEVEVFFESMRGGAVSGAHGNVTVTKHDEETDEILEGVTFRLQKMNSDNNFENYTPRDNESVKMTDDEGKVVFTHLEAGVYKVVEVAGLPGYSNVTTYYPDDTFTIHHTATNEHIDIDAYNAPLDETRRERERNRNPSNDNDPNHPNTGDNSPMVLLATTGAISLMALPALLCYMKKKEWM